MTWKKQTKEERAVEDDMEEAGWGRKDSQR